MSKMTPTRRQYTREFKLEAVKLVTENGYSFQNAAQSLGITHSMLRNWKKKFESESDTSNDGTHLSMEEDNRRLREENRRLKMERDILKKATAFFAKESQ